MGLKWDDKNYSCSYDSLFVILYNIWKENPDKWTDNFTNINRHMQALANGFKQVDNESISLETARDDIRETLHNLDSEKFSMGANSASVAELAIKLMESTNRNGISQVYCTQCDYAENE